MIDSAEARHERLLNGDLLERELRGNVYIARMRLEHTNKGGNAAAIKQARTSLAMAYNVARAERVAPFWKGAKR